MSRMFPTDLAELLLLCYLTQFYFIFLQPPSKRSKKGKDKLPLSKMKVVRQSFAVGGLDQDYVDWGMGTPGSAASSGGSKGGMTKGQIRQAARDKPFTEFDSSKKMRKGGKVGVKAFKSKSKFKRR